MAIYLFKIGLIRVDTCFVHVPRSSRNLCLAVFPCEIHRQRQRYPRTHVHVSSRTYHHHFYRYFRHRVRRNVSPSRSLFYHIAVTLDGSTYDPLWSVVVASILRLPTGHMKPSEKNVYTFEISNHLMRIERRLTG